MHFQRAELVETSGWLGLERRHSVLNLSSLAYWLSGGLITIAGLAAGATFFVPGVLRGVPVMNGSARGTALVLFAVALPLLAISMWLTSRGSARAAIAWLGALEYILYNAVMFLFGTPFNQLFLLYVAMFGLTISSTFALIVGIDVDALRARFARGTPVHAIAVFMLVVVVLNAGAWLAQIIPATFSQAEPAFLAGTGLTTFPTHVQDLAFWLPLTAVAAVWLWRRFAWGYLLVGAGLTMYAVEGVGVGIDQWFGHLADPSSTVVASALVPAFFVLAAVTLVPLYLLFRGLRPALTP